MAGVTNSYTLIETNHSNETNYLKGKDAQYYIDNKEAVRLTSDNGGRIKTNRIIRKPHLDVLGYITSITEK